MRLSNTRLNPLYFGSLVPTESAENIPLSTWVLIPFISGLWFLPKTRRARVFLCRLNPLYFGSLVPTTGRAARLHGRRRLNPLYFGSLVPTSAPPSCSSTS